MILNARQNQFIIYFSPTFFYKEVQDQWLPIINRFKLPFTGVSDYINSCIQSVTFPAIDILLDTQQESQYKITWRGGKEIEPIFDKTLIFTFKLSEAYTSYWVWYQQIQQFLQYANGEKPFMDDLYLSFLDHNGFEIVNFRFKQLTPSNVSQFEISYALTSAEFTTFNITFKYNRFDVTYKF